MKTTLMNVVRKKLEVDEDPDDPEMKPAGTDSVEAEDGEHDEEEMDVNED